MKYLPFYNNSHALIIGINDYLNAGPLTYAVNDAEAVAEILNTKFSFPKENITFLKENEASRKAIIKQYLEFRSTDENDRILFFFAGHGYTIKSRNGSAGYLVPQDGSIADLSSLIRWEDITINTDLIPAKHLFFIMDACYSGLVFNRTPGPAATRLVGDMLTRFARQAIAAGQDDQEVADFGGPLPNHSIFTGYLLEGLDGEAADPNAGVITANGLMAYVRQRVGFDARSRQTPHYGTLEGSGDFIFNIPEVIEQSENKTISEDILVEIPGTPLSEPPTEKLTFVDRIKKYLADKSSRIQLHDLVVAKTRDALAITSSENFPVSGGWSNESFLSRLEGYESALSELLQMQTLLGYWADPAFANSFKVPLKRFTERINPESGLVIWSVMRWYPALLLTYVGGIGAVASQKYDNLYTIFHIVVSDYHSADGQQPLITSLYEFFTRTPDAFKSIPGHEKNFVPRSEYLYKLLQPLIDDLLFLGTDYENVFDKFEILLGLEFGHLFEKKEKRVWSPVGRFGWKHKGRGSQGSPLVRVILEAREERDNWKPLKSGFFDGSFNRFENIATQYLEFADGLPYY